MTYQQGPYGPPPMAPQRPRRSAGVPVLVVGLLVVAIVAVVHGVQLHGSTKTPTAQPVATGTGATPGVLAETAADTLADQLTYELETHNRSAFLSHMSGSARSSATTWWDNWDSIGFDYGTADAVEDKSNIADQATTATIELAIGMHDKLGPVTKDDAEGDPQYGMPETYYQLTLQAQRSSSSPLVTSWKGISNAPWDDGKLFVARTAHSVTAGPADQKSYIEAESKVAEKAAVWVRTFLGHFSGFVQQQGFVSFVSAKGSDRGRWFSTTTKPRGWVSDPSKVGGFFKPLPEVQGETGDTKVNTGVVGGGYVVLGNKIPNAVDNEGTMVHEFTHDLVGIDDVWAFGDSKPLPAWVVEGFARWVEAFFHDTPNNPNKKAALSEPYLKPTLQAAGHPRFTGQPPSDALIYGNAAYANYYYDESATTYEYLASKYGADAAFHAALIGYLGGPDGPFAGILQKESHGTLYYYDPDTLRAAWAAFYLKTYGR